MVVVAADNDDAASAEMRATLAEADEDVRDDAAAQWPVATAIYERATAHTEHSQ